MTPTPPDLTPDGSSIFGRLLNATTDRVSLDAWLAPLRNLTAFSPLSEIERALVHVREQIPSDIDDLSRATLKASAREALKRTRVTAAMIDAAFAPPPKTTKQDPSSKPKALAVQLVHDDEPWPTPVAGTEVFDEVASVVRKYVALPEAFIDAIALWVAHAGFLAAAAIMPMLAIVAVTMRAGKSTCAEIVAALAPRGLLVSSMTPAVVFRLVDAYHPTLIADEADTWLTDERSELRGIFNSGHSRSTAVVARCVGDEHDVKLFSTWAPKVIAMIGKPPATIMDRSILVSLKRKRPDERVERLRHAHLVAASIPIRRRLRRWADDHVAQYQSVEPNVPAGLHDRAADNWRGLLAVAELAGGTWPDRARAAAVAIATASDADAESINVELLADVKQVIAASGTKSWITSADLTAGLVALEDRPWAEWSGGKPITALKLAGRLKTFGIRSYKQRDGTKTYNAYQLGAFMDAWGRYLQDNSEHSERTNVFGPRSEISNSEQTGHVPTSRTQNAPMFTGLVPSVPTPTGEMRVAASVAMSDVIQKGCTCAALGDDAPCGHCDGPDREAPNELF